MSDNQKTALRVLSQLGTGVLDRTLFTPQAAWWSNIGRHFPLGEFQEMLTGLHKATIDGLQIDTGLIIVDKDRVIVEATSDVPLKNGGVYANRYLFLFHFDGDLVREVREYNDTAHVFASFAIPQI